jgi:hypothetical protein
MIADKYNGEKYTGLSWAYYTRTGEMGFVDASYYTFSIADESKYIEVELAPRYIKYSCLRSVFNMGVIKC